MQIIIDHVDYIYDKKTAYENKALVDINCVINKGEYVGLIGHTGSGKSTLIQLINGLLKPTSGTIYFNGEDIFEKGYSLKKMRAKVGLVFQYSEHQLFEASVIEDVKFGPRNICKDKLKIDMAAYEALKMVGISEDLLDISPLELSGGEKRRVAIAGVLAMEPEVLILDEPTAGLDPKGRDDILSILKKINRENNTTIILVSHSMENVAEYADKIITMNEGRIHKIGTPQEVFSDYREMSKIGLSVPENVYILKGLREKGFNVRTDVISDEEVVAEIMKLQRNIR